MERDWGGSKAPALVRWWAARWEPALEWVRGEGWEGAMAGGSALGLAPVKAPELAKWWGAGWGQKLVLAMGRGSERPLVDGLELGLERVTGRGWE